MGRDRAQRLGGLLVAVLLAYLVLVPIGAVVWGSLGTELPGLPGPRTLANYRTALTDPQLLGAVRTSLVFAAGATVVSCLIGGYLAWLTQRTDVPGRRWLTTLTLLPIVVPGILPTVAWILLLHPSIGLLNDLALLAGASAAPFDAFTLTAMVWVEGVDGITLPFLILAAAMRTMDPALEEASVLSGAPLGRTVRLITAPVLLPSIGAAVLLSLVRNLGSFAVPVAMGLPGGVRVLTTQVYLANRSFPSDTNLAATYAVLHLVIATAILVVHQRIVRDDGRHGVVGARARPSRIGLRGSRRWHAAAASTLLVVAIVLPLIVVVVGSLVPYQPRPSELDAATLGLGNYAWALEDPVVRRGVLNNALVGSTASLLTVLLGAVVAWTVVRSRVRWRRVIDGLANAPLALPGTVLALALLWWYLQVPLPIHATRWIIVIGFVTAFLPYATRTAVAMLGQTPREFEEASAVSGAGWTRTFVRVILPLAGPVLAVTWLYVLARTLKSLAIPVMLAGPRQELLPVALLGLLDDAKYPELNAVGVLLMLALLTIVTAANLAGRLVDRLRANGPVTMLDAQRDRGTVG